MATKVAIAIKRQGALARIEDAQAALNKRLKVPYNEIPKQGNDADLLFANQLEAIADWMESALNSAALAPRKRAPRKKAGKAKVAA